QFVGEGHGRKWSHSGERKCYHRACSNVGLGLPLTDQCERPGGSIAAIHGYGFRHNEYGGELVSGWHSGWKFICRNHLINRSVHCPTTPPSESQNSNRAERRKCSQSGERKRYHPGCSNVSLGLHLTDQCERADGSIRTIHGYGFRHNEYGGELVSGRHSGWELFGGHDLPSGFLHSPIEPVDEHGNSDGAECLRFGEQS